MNIGKDNSKNRDLWIRKVLSRIEDGARILDAGAGEQQYKKYCKHLDYVSQDFAQYDGKGNNHGMQMDAWDYGKLDIICDIVNIPEEDASFDAIMCTEVFEHLPNPILAIKEFSRLLKRGGKLILTAPFCSLTHFAPFHYYTGFNKYFYEYYFDKYKFKIIDMDKNGNYFEYIAQELRRLPNICKEYSNYNYSLEDFKDVSRVIEILDSINKENNNSEEILCHGYHILAEKV
ncbi:hypothetical protein NL50_02100 [Clostridium acetobutylicum]|nr:hypothetical protein NL50_02100 [Clostridium acetobutylicum]